MMLLMIIHRRLLLVAVLMLVILCSNFVISQRINNNGGAGVGGRSEQQQQQQQQQQLVQSNTTAAAAAETTGVTKQQQKQNGVDDKQVIATKTKTTTSTTSSVSNATSSVAATATTTTTQRRSSGETFPNGESNEDRHSSEILSESEDEEHSISSITPTTYRPQRGGASIAPHTSAQERERKLMNVLAARRSALQRGGFRTRVGTTGRTATAIETTSKAPTDPRSICIRNCTKNFTRRTTASCMRQCANFSRNAVAAAAAAAANGTSAVTVVVVRPSSKTGTGTQTGERGDTNEILFTDESSHGLFVVAKEQNDTINHIPDTVKGSVASAKFRSRGKPAIQAVTIASTSIEDDDLQPYLYFGQKLPPIKPATLTITSVSDEHPRLLEVSVTQLSSTTPASVTATTSTLSPVERSRSRYKYNMRERGNTSFNRRYSGPGRPLSSAVVSDSSAELKVSPPVVTNTSSTTEQTKEYSPPKRVTDSIVQKQTEVIKEAIVTKKLFNFTAVTASPVTKQISSSTPLIITVLSDEDDVTPAPLPLQADANKLNLKTSSTTSTTTIGPSTSSTTTTTTTKSPTTPISTSSTTSTTTTTVAAPTTLRFTSTSTAIPTTTTAATTTTVIPSPTTTAIPSPTTPKRKTLIEEDAERLRALGPSLTQHINTDDKTNLIIFINRTASSSGHPTTKRPFANAPTTDASSTILHTTVLSSVRSTVNPRPSTSQTYVGVVETAPAEENPTQTSATGGGDIISSTVVTNEREVTLEMRRMNIVTMVLAGIGIFPLLAIVLYLVRNFIVRRNCKDDEDFDVCITDQQPISPVKKLDSKYSNADDDGVDDDEDEVDHQATMHHSQLSATGKLHRQSHGNQLAAARDINHNHYDDKCSMSSDQEFERSNIRLKSLLGEGNFGQVWKAEADDLSGHFGATRIVAVKTIRACSAQVGLKDEANIMRKLGSHQNVVTLLGACVESEPHMLIMEYAMRGRLLSLLRAARNATNILPASVPGGRSLAPLSPRTLAGFALDIACGMEYIAERRIVHRDLAARNVLLDHNGVCKICDFGMSIDLNVERKKKEQEKNCANDIMRSNANKFKFDFGGRFIMNHWSQNFGGANVQPADQKEMFAEKKSQHHHQQQHHHHQGHGHGHANGHGNGHDTISRRPALPIRWMAPEALQYHVFTTQTDVWAFGIVLWEIATLGSTPYSQITGREVIRRVPNGLRPDLPKEGRHEFYNLMARCWHKDPQMRPSFAQTRLEVTRSLHKWVDDDSAASDYMDVSGFSEDLEHGMVYFNHRISEFECEI